MSIISSLVDISLNFQEKINTKYVINMRLRA